MLRFVVLLASTLSGVCFGQCENGQCRLTPVRNTVAAVAKAQPVRSAVRGVYQSVQSVQAKGYGSSGVAQNYGSSGSSLSVGSRDYDGTYISQVGSVVVYPGVTIEATDGYSAQWFGGKQRKKSRQVIVESAEKAAAEGVIDANQLQAIKLASRSPRMLARMEDLIVEKAQASGAYQFKLDANGDVVASAIDWEAIGDFILKIAPLIFKLIDMFAIVSPADSCGLASFDQVDFVSTIGWRLDLAC